MTYKNYENPSNLNCFVACSSCMRCQDKGKHDKCKSCSGRHDPDMKRDPYHFEDRCRCKEGILQYRLQNGKMVRKKFESNPFVSKVITESETADESDWKNFVGEMREKYNDPTFDPVTLEDGTSTLDLIDKAREN